MKSIQKEHRDWIAKKYPNQPAKIPAIGCLEEAGELLHCVLKTEQIRLWGEDTRHKLAKLRVKTVDAIGDCGIYACSLCNAMDWNFEEEWEVATHEPLTRPDALHEAIMLVQVATEVALNPHCIAHLYIYLKQLVTISKCLGIDAEMAVTRTWQIVRTR